MWGVDGADTGEGEWLRQVRQVAVPELPGSVVPHEEVVE